jgi:hypothetical protein
MKTPKFLSFGVALSVVFGGAAMAQTSPTDEEILRAWLASPHADASSEAFRHWDSDAEIPGTCAVCHSTTGIVDYLAAPQTKAGVIDHPVPIGTTVECSACHNPGAQALKEVLFPSGERVAMTQGSAVCTVCHQGRTSGADVAAAVAGIGEDVVSPTLGFINIHYAAAASTNLGSAVRGGYEYEGQAYAGQFGHVQGLGTCVDCHNAHETEVKLENCTTCHQGVTEFRAIRTTPLDILGDGRTDTGIALVIDTLHERLGEAIKTYAVEAGGGAILYSDGAYPYFFNDLNANGLVDDGEAVFPNRYQSWTPRLLRAAYNFQFVGKDHGAFAHNPHYVLQLMIDSIADLATVTSVDAGGLVRP